MSMSTSATRSGPGPPRKELLRCGSARLGSARLTDYRHVELASLDDALDGYAEIGQPRWASWRRKLQLTETVPEHFGRTLESLKGFANPIITGSITDPATWDPRSTRMEPRGLTIFNYGGY
jgi:hypothetical protein